MYRSKINITCPNDGQAGHQTKLWEEVTYFIIKILFSKRALVLALFWQCIFMAYNACGYYLKSM